jgi:hypothetical protein
MAAYAATTGAATAAVLAGDAVPATLPVLLVFDAVEAARADLPADIWSRIHGGVHGEHDLLLHRALRSPQGNICTDVPRTVWQRGNAGSVVRSGSTIGGMSPRMPMSSVWALILLGAGGFDDVGTMPAEHRFPESAMANPLGSAVQHVAEDTARRYALSGDRAVYHSTSRSPDRPDSTTCSRTACARWRCARTACSTRSASTIPLW